METLNHQKQALPLYQATQIQRFKVQLDLKPDPNIFNNTWAQLEAHINYLFETDPTQNQQFFKEISYKSAINLCRLKMSQRLTSNVTQKIGTLISFKITQLKELLSQNNVNGNSDQSMEIDSGNQISFENNSERLFLDRFKLFWIQFCISMQGIKDIFLYLERTFLILNVNPDMQTFWNIGLNQLRKEIGEDLKQKLIKGVLNLIQVDRQDEKRTNFLYFYITLYLIANLIHVMLALNFYKGSFEDQFLKQTEEFFTKDSNDKIQSLNLSSYLIYVDQITQKESERVDECLDISTKNSLLRILNEGLITTHTTDMLESEDFSKFIADQRVEDLKRLYELLKRVDKQILIRIQWSKIVKTRGEALLKDAQFIKKSFKGVEDILEFKKQAEDLISKVFPLKEDSDPFKTYLKQALEHFLNIDPNMISEYLAKFLDLHLRKSSGQTGITDEKLEQIIHDVIQVFRYVKSKDVFEEFYARGLCRRLLLKKSASFEAEKTMISKLKTECGDQFTAKVEGMLVDLTVSDSFISKLITSQFRVFI